MQEHASHSQNTDAVDYAGRVRIARALTLGLLVLLVLLFTYQTLLAPSFEREPNVVVWAICVLPFILLLPGLIRGRYTTFIWLCYIDLLYFMVAITNWFIPGYGWIAYLEVGLNVALFTVAMFCARWIKLRNAERLQQQSANSD